MYNQEPYKSVLRLCANKERSSREILEHLLQKGVSSQEASEILSKLKDNKILDDRRFTQEKIRIRVNRNRWGKNRILEELHFHQISEEIISQELSSITDDVWNSTLQRHILTYTNKPLKYIQKKLYDLGFEEERILQQLKITLPNSSI